MKELKPLDHRILSELMKNAKRSDREIAKELGVSQATVSRRRTFLERELIDGYTAVPKWDKLGFEILAITLVKTKQALGIEENYTTARNRGTKWLMKQPNVIMSGGCRGMSVDGFMFSVHKNYSRFDNFMAKHKRELGDTFTDVQTIIINLGGNQILKPFHLKYLAELNKKNR